MEAPRLHVSRVPPSSIAAMVSALPPGGHPSASFRDAARATLRLTRARGRVECEALAAIFAIDDISDDRRTLVLDLLASAGTPEAQRVMRRLLSLDVARRDRRTFASFVQRLGFVERPCRATLRFLVRVYTEGKHEAPEVRAAYAYALGGGAGRAHVWGRSDVATRASEVLRRDLLLATEAAEKCALLAALGAAGIETDVGVILRFVEDRDGRVRSAAALALKRMHTREVRSSLLSLLTSDDEGVASGALSALFEQILEPDELTRLAELAVAGCTPLALDGRVLRLVVTQRLNAVESSDVEALRGAISFLTSRIEARAGHAVSACEAELPIASPSRSGFTSRAWYADESPSRACAGPMPPTLHPRGDGDAGDGEPRPANDVRVSFKTPSKVRTLSAVTVASPIAPLAVLR